MSARRHAPGRPHGAALLLVAVALALRWWDWGNPVIHVDEQYYLLVGDRMLDGAVPYLDLWDRKPVGLFLLYAAMRLLPGDGILAYQLTATLAAALTATIVAATARRAGAGARGAAAAGIAYLLTLELLGGRGGQAPVFYNLPMAAAAGIVMELPALAAAQRCGAIVGRGIVACLLAGVAIQIKYTAAVEAAFFGLALLHHLRRGGARLPLLAAATAAWLIAGLAPTALAGAWYAGRGDAAWQAWWFANFASILHRPGYPATQLAMRLLGIAALLAPLIVAAAMTIARSRRVDGDRGTTALAIGWLAAATIGFAAIGTFFDHYALPLAAPLAVVAAPTLERSRRALIAALALPALLWAGERVRAHDDAAGARAVASVVADATRRRGAGDGPCPYVFIGDTVTYLLAHACVPTRYAFPNLLAYTTEQGATGIDEAAETRRILARRPPAIVTSDRRLAIWNRGSRAAVVAALARDYQLVFVARRADWRTLVYRRVTRP